MGRLTVMTCKKCEGRQEARDNESLYPGRDTIPGPTAQDALQSIVTQVLKVMHLTS
jgi:hypothetical protein